jgi:regulation of enolase protein 1 (concanavalin A-like superfamily)
MRPVVGDFAAEVRAGPLARSSFPGRVFHSAGLLLRQDDGNLARLESAMIGAPQDVRYVLFEVRQGGRALDVSPAPMTLRDGPVDLRLERRASKLLALVSQNGEKWREVARVTVALPDAMEIGVTVVNTGERATRAVGSWFQTRTIRSQASAVSARASAHTRQHSRRHLPIPCRPTGPLSPTGWTRPRGC